MSFSVTPNIASIQKKTRTVMRDGPAETSDVPFRILQKSASGTFPGVIKTTGEAGGMLHAFKAMMPAARHGL